MRQRLNSVSLYQTIVVLGKLLLMLVAGVFFVVLLLLPIIATSMGAHHIPQSPLLWPNLQTTQQPAATLSNGNPGSSQTPQVQAMLTESQNNITVANTIVTFTGVFVSIVTVAVATASFFGISELLKIRELREKLQSDINENTQQIKDQLATVMQDFQSQFDKVTEQTAHIENQLKLLDNRIEEESQKLLEAAFYYSEGSKLYRSGDNQHAIEFYLRALKIRPKNLSILERLGRAYSNLNDIDNASKYLNEALAIDPEDETILRSLSLLYRSTEPENMMAHIVKTAKSAQIRATRLLSTPLCSLKMDGVHAL
jgi:tetratricopeptide (TPR) repeat protein